MQRVAKSKSQYSAFDYNKLMIPKLDLSQNLGRPSATNQLSKITVSSPKRDEEYDIAESQTLDAPGSKLNSQIKSPRPIEVQLQYAE